MNTSQTVSKITAAIAAVQAKIEPITKNKAVKVEGEKARWESNYATLATLDAAIREHVRGAGIAIIQSVEQVPQLGPVLVTRAAVEDEWIEVSFPIKESRAGAQGFGGGISFARRWGTCALWNLVPDDIEEGQGYRDAAREGKAPRKAAAPPGLGTMLDAIRDADTLKSFEAAARTARGAHPAGEAAASVERSITARFVVSIDNADTAEKVQFCRDAYTRIQPRGTEVRDAFSRADRRLRGEV